MQRLRKPLTTWVLLLVMTWTSVFSASGAVVLQQKNRVWENFETNKNCAEQIESQALEPRLEIELCAYEIASCRKRFHSMDTYEGRNGEPLTLHKYLYANANPVTNVDPSGNAITLAGQSATIGINLSFSISVNQAWLAVGASWLTGKALTSRWNMSLWMEGWHMAIVAENIHTGRIWHYDWFERAERGSTGAIKCGYIQKYPGLPAGGYKIPSAIYLSELGFRLWEKTFGFGEQFQDIGNGSFNCWTWALKAESVAFIYSFIPF